MYTLKRIILLILFVLFFEEEGGGEGGVNENLAGFGMDESGKKFFVNGFGEFGDVERGEFGERLARDEVTGGEFRGGSQRQGSGLRAEGTGGGFVGEDPSELLDRLAGKIVEISFFDVSEVVPGEMFDEIVKREFEPAEGLRVEERPGIGDRVPR